MSEPTVVVVEDAGEPPAVQVAEDAAVVEVALVAGAASERAEEACEEAEQATVVAGEALAAAELAMGSCCEHCENHAVRLSSLEEGRAAELEAAVEQELDAPAPAMREEKPKSESKRVQAPPTPKRGGFWPLG